MKTLFQRLALPVVFALMSLGCFAATPGVTLLFSNGTTASFAFVSKPVIAVAADGLTVSSTGTSAVAYSFTDVQKFYFEDNVETGISQIEATSPALRPVFNYVGGVVKVSGMSAGERFVVVTLSGSQVEAVKANSEGCVSVDLGNVPAGVYVVSTGCGVSFKLLKK